MVREGAALYLKEAENPHLPFNLEAWRPRTTSQSYTLLNKVNSENNFSWALRKAESRRHHPVEAPSSFHFRIRPCSPSPHIKSLNPILQRHARVSRLLSRDDRPRKEMARALSTLLMIWAGTLDRPP